MRKKRIKKEIKEPDFFIKAVNWFQTYIRTHLRLVIILSSSVVLIICLFILYAWHEKKRENELQYELSKAAVLFRQSILTGNESYLSQAEKIFLKIAKEKEGTLSDIARFYLARIKEMRQEKKEAKKDLEAISQSSQSSILRDLAERALRELD
ncbi:MAG: hypothetical protein NZ583_02360 [Desulfobacterota bacterium]|nr:hypothetical protein [Thermodesulfobacteriota bacterium]MDW8001728.1 hypothetical protein [Deltaproteobacteria bacterium]